MMTEKPMKLPNYMQPQRRGRFPDIIDMAGFYLLCRPCPGALHALSIISSLVMSTYSSRGMINVLLVWVTNNACLKTTYFCKP